MILKPPGDFDRAALFAAFGRAVQSLAGAYITAEDVGTTTADMRVVQRRTAFVSGIPRDGAFGGDPSPKTAWGVFVAIEAGVQQQFKRASLEGVSVAVQGLGSVGMHLAQHLHLAGTKLVVADVNVARAEEARERFGAEVVGVDEIAAAPADVFAPCALGAVLNANTNEGKVITASFLDNWNNIVRAVRDNPSLVQAKAGKASQANAAQSVQAGAAAEGDVMVAKIAGAKVLRLPQDGSGELMTLGKADEVLYLGEEKNGFLKVTAAKGDGWVKKVLLKKP
ncbi:MAG: hypothetical protein E6H79_01120 [Betaproteobacteria bacterium]|nr:MAG: hypothetical protein E6H79_01120 [Betaproteobacteria bacterium]